MKELTSEQIQILNELVEARMANTGEDRRTAAIAVNRYIVKTLAAKAIHNEFHPAN